MRFELYKILDKKYANDFIKGYLYMNTVSYFRTIEGNIAQGDPMEGVCGTIRKDQLKQVGVNLDDEILNVVQGNVSLVSNYYGLNHLFCLYRLCIDDDRDLVSIPSEKLRDFNDDGNEEKIVVRIKNTREFIKRVSNAIEAGLANHELEYGICGSVVYEDSWLHADGPGSRSVFFKESKYAYQNEWRLCLLRRLLIEQPYKFFVGNLEDITETVALDEFLTCPESLYPGYTSACNIEVHRDGFGIFGNVNAVNHLMFSYMSPLMEERPSRSDQAQADWHYTKYLILTGQEETVDAYLERQMKSFKDLEHLELLVQYRCSVGDWIRATDAYMFFINEEPEVIKKDGDKFFFTLHTILMQHKPIEAGKLLLIATRNYNISEDIKLVMQRDVYLALGFYDQALPLYEELQKNSKDPIIRYYQAVCFLYLLEFEKAQLCISEYEKYFSHVPETSWRVKRLHKIIGWFQGEEILDRAPAAHYFDELTWDGNQEELLKERTWKGVYPCCDILYKLEKYKKWDLIDSKCEVIICPLTIVRMVDMYEQTGDEIIIRSILHLKTCPGLKIRSPELAGFLAMDKLYPGIPMHVKMERALWAQEHG